MRIFDNRQKITFARYSNELLINNKATKKKAHPPMLIFMSGKILRFLFFFLPLINFKSIFLYVSYLVKFMLFLIKVIILSTFFFFFIWLHKNVGV